MASNSSTLIVRFMANTTQLQTQLRRSEAQLSGFAKAARRAGVVMAAAFGGKLVIDAIGSQVLAFANLQEQIAATEQVYKGAAQSVIDYASTTANAFGLNQTEALKASNQLFMFASNMNMSQQEAAKFSAIMLELAGDLAAFRDTDIDQAIAAITSAFAGQSRPIRQYGIDVTDAEKAQALLARGIDATVGSMDKEQKALGTYYALMDQTVLIQGQATREMYQTGTQLRRLEGITQEVGVAFGEGVTTGISDMNDGLESVIQTADDSREMMKDFGKTIGDQISPVVGLTQKVALLNSEIQKLPGGSSTGGGILSWLASAGELASFTADDLDRVFDALGILLRGPSGFKLYKSDIETLFGKNNILTDTIIDATSAIDDQIRAIQGFSPAAEIASGALDTLILKNRELASGRYFYNLAARNTIAAQVSDMNDLYRLRKEQEEADKGLKRTAGSVRDLSEALQDLDAKSVNIGNVKIVMSELKDLTGDQAKGINDRWDRFVTRWTNTWERYQEDLQKARDYVEDWQATLISSLDIGKAFTLANDAQAREAEALDKLNNVLADPNATAQQISKARNAYYKAAEEAAIGFQERFAQQIRDASAFMDALGNLKNSGMNEALIRQVAALGPVVGTELANELVSGGGALIDTLNAQWDKVDKQAYDLGISMSDTFQQVGYSNAVAMVDGFNAEVNAAAKKVTRNIEKKFSTTVTIKYVADTSGLPNIGNTTSVRQGGFTSRSGTSRGRQIVEDIQAYELVSGSSWRV